MALPATPPGHGTREVFGTLTGIVEETSNGKQAEAQISIRSVYEVGRGAKKVMVRVGIPFHLKLLAGTYAIKAEVNGKACASHATLRTGKNTNVKINC